MLGLGNAMCHDRTCSDRTAGQDWDLWTQQAGVELLQREPMLSHHIFRDAFAALVAAACMYPVSSYLSSGAFPKSAGVHPRPFPTLLLALLFLSSVFAV